MGKIIDENAIFAEAKAKVNAWRAKGRKSDYLAMGLFTLTELVHEANARIAALEAQLAESGTKSFVDSYEGVHVPGKLYRRGATVTRAGSCWLCLSDSTEPPGKSAAWRLVVKRGRNARDVS